MNEAYLTLLWREIKANSEETAVFIRDMHQKFNTRLHTFRWKKEPKVIVCKYRKESA